MAEDNFELWLGHIGKDRPFAQQVRKAANLAGGAQRSSAARARRFDGSRIGRGSGIGRLLGSSDRLTGFRARRVVVKARFVKLAGKGAKAAAAHLRYLQRDGTTREGERGTLYAADRDVADGKAFLERGAGDRHQFRFIVAPEDGAQYDDLKPLVRRWMAQVEQDLGTKLDWVAVDHFNTGHPHSHVLVRGVVVARGLSDEYNDHHYMIVAATDGRSLYIELGDQPLSEMLDYPEIVKVNPVVPAVREADRVVAEVAAANGGVYSVERHLRHDPSATRRFAEAHVRRLEAIRRSRGEVERLPDGSWKIAPDHLDRALAHERSVAAARPVEVETLAERPLAQLVRHDGVTWLDEQQAAKEPETLERGFGAQLRRAMALRQQWLIEQDLAWRDENLIHFRPGMMAELRRRELRQVAGQLSKEMRLGYVEHRGGAIEGTYRKAVQVGSAKYAVIEKSREFTLVPWRPVLEKQIGRHVSGIDRAGSISWTFGRQRSGPDMGGV